MSSPNDLIDGAPVGRELQVGTELPGGPTFANSDSETSPDNSTLAAIRRLAAESAAEQGGVSERELLEAAQRASNDGPPVDKVVGVDVADRSATATHDPNAAPPDLQVFGRKQVLEAIARSSVESFFSLNSVRAVAERPALRSPLMLRMLASNDRRQEVRGLVASI